MEQILKEKKARLLTDRELVELSMKRQDPCYALEKTLGDTTRAVKIRRAIISRTAATAETTSFLESSLLPYEHYDFDRVFGCLLRDVIGYMPLPVGVAGPIVIDGQSFFLPMATTEVSSCSTNRGARLSTLRWCSHCFDWRRHDSRTLHWHSKRLSVLVLPKFGLTLRTAREP